MNVLNQLRIEGERHSGILTYEDQILLIHRIKNNFEYYVLPGGHREQGEIGTQTVIREITEETGITVRKAELIYKQQVQNDNLSPHTDYIYLCSDYNFQQPVIIGEEKDRNSSQNFYEPIWMKIPELTNLNILPLHLKRYLLTKFTSNKI